MEMITSIKALLPVAETAAQPVQPGPRQTNRETGANAPLAMAMMAGAAHQVPLKIVAYDPQLQAARSHVEISAAVAAEAARAAYIRASIAAGINPLPLS